VGEAARRTWALGKSLTAHSLEYRPVQPYSTVVCILVGLISKSIAPLAVQVALHNSPLPAHFFTQLGLHPISGPSTVKCPRDATTISAVIQALLCLINLQYSMTFYMFTTGTIQSSSADTRLMSYAPLLGFRIPANSRWTKQRLSWLGPRCCWCTNGHRHQKQLDAMSLVACPSLIIKCRP